MHKRILFISDHGDPLAPLGSEQAGGQNNYVKQLALALDRQGYTVDVATHWADENTPRTETFGNKCRVIRIAAGHKGFVQKSKLYQMLYDFYDEMEEMLDIGGYELIHTHYWLSGLLGAKLQQNYAIPWIHTSHSLGVAKEQATGVREEKRIMAEKYILSHADVVIATTETEKSLISKFVKEPAPIRVVSIGVDDSFQPDLHKPASGQPLFAFAGRLESTKGLFTLLRVFRKLMKHNDLPPSTKLIIAGGSADQVDPVAKQPTTPKLKAAIQDIEEHVEFIGGQGQAELAQLFNRATAVIVPSTYESFGMVAAEAQACGCPVIASRVGGLQDVVRHRETGLHVEVDHDRSLAAAMKFLAANEDFARLLGRKAAARAKQEFNWEAIAKQMASIYEVVRRETQKVYAGD